MTPDEFLALARDAGALMEGHFLLSSGLHSPAYFQCARVLEWPSTASRLGAALAEKLKAEVDLAIGPALGGILVAHEVARSLGVRAVFVERVPGSGELTLRRGFTIRRGERVVAVEDVVTTGRSLRETMEAARARGGDIVAAGALVDRRQNRSEELHVPFHALVRLDFPTYPPASCPLCRSGSTAVKPGSRPGLRQGSDREGPSSSPAR